MSQDPLIHTTIEDRYWIKSPLGVGGMGCVFLAENLKLNRRPCAIKVLKNVQSGNQEEEIRFEAELKIISQLRSPHIVQVFDQGKLDDGRLYIVMELLEGESLAHLMFREGPFPPERALKLIAGILGGLAAAHEQGVIHRDLKPGNIFVNQSVVGYDIVKILDFGIAKDTSREGDPLTRTDQFLGTPQYMAPEQVNQNSLDGRADLYMTGLILYEMLSGHPPFHPDRSVLPDSIQELPPEVQLMWLQLKVSPEPLDLPSPLWNLVSKLLEKKPSDRPSSATETLAIISDLLSDPTNLELSYVQPAQHVQPAQQDDASTDPSIEGTSLETADVNGPSLPQTLPPALNFTNISSESLYTSPPTSLYQSVANLKQGELSHPSSTRNLQIMIIGIIVIVVGLIIKFWLVQNNTTQSPEEGVEVYTTIVNPPSSDEVEEISTPSKRSLKRQADRILLKVGTPGLFFQPGSKISLKTEVQPSSAREQLRYVIKPKGSATVKGHTLIISRHTKNKQLTVSACVHSKCSNPVTIRVGLKTVPK